jgi:hypothetical protein
VTVALGIMQLPAPQDGDSIRRYETGTLPDGGMWTALTRASNHDHTGGLNGKPISVASIPDGSITTAKLDPSVLAPYALTDASKPFTGQLTMNADAIVRDHLYFGAKPAGVADVTLQRTGAGALRVDTNLGVGVNPAAWHSTLRAINFATGAAVWSDTSGTQATLSANTVLDATAAYKSSVTGPASMVQLTNGTVTAQTAPSVAAGAAQTFTTRAQINATGTLTLTPDATANALVYPGRLALGEGAGVNGRIQALGASAALEIVAASTMPWTDNFESLGGGSNRWTTVYAVNGTIQTSSTDLKTDITPLDPAACAQAVLDTDWVAFEYTPPPLTPGPPDETVAQSTKRVSAHSRMVQETAFARKQNGYVLNSPSHRTSALFGLSDRKSASPQADLGVVACALQDALHRIAALEGATP